LAKVTLAPLPAAWTVKPWSPTAMWLVAPESSTQVDDTLVLPSALLVPG